ncbi:MAG: cytochrome P460 family protein [Burkholderiales bacterium]|nr:cytochrome P460 family protein [Burkholderiales bacterium]
MTSRTAFAAVAFATFFASGSALAADPPPVPYPAGYRAWVHVKTMQILPGHPLHGAFGGVHHLYANPKAMTGYRSGRFPDGAVIVFDLAEAVSADNTVTDGNRKVVGVMRKDAKRYAATGGWGFEGFKGDSRTERAVGANAAEACFGCHAPQKAKDYVFSAWKD